MILSLVLTAFASLVRSLILPTDPALSPQPQLFDLSDYLCYDSRYANHEPSPIDCFSIINSQIALYPSITAKRTFSRHPSKGQEKLPHTWSTVRQECNITIDIPELPKQRAGLYERASMLDIKIAANHVVLGCVLDHDHLGGVQQIGTNGKMQLRIQAGARSKI